MLSFGVSWYTQSLMIGRTLLCEGYRSVLVPLAAVILHPTSHIPSNTTSSTAPSSVYANLSLYHHGQSPFLVPKLLQKRRTALSCYSLVSSPKKLPGNSALKSPFFTSCFFISDLAHFQNLSYRTSYWFTSSFLT